MMKAIEFEATAERNSIRLPDAIPDGTRLRVLLLMDDSPAIAAAVILERCGVRLLNPFAAAAGP
jgi:hypothetical protein